MVHVINPVAIPMCFVVLQEEVSAKLLEFLESPCITRDVVLTDDKVHNLINAESSLLG
jgi:hypothetical protein